MSVDLFNWRQHLKVHAAADLFPLMSEPELKELAENIKKNGLQQPILIWRQHGVGTGFQDYLIDGRNRLDALAMLGWLAPQRGRAHRERQDGFKRLLPLIVDYPKDSFSEHIRPYDSLSPEWRGFELRSGLCEEDDAYRLVLSLNIHRRHLTAAQKRDLITRVLKRDPQISDRQIGETVKADHKTVGAVRAELESTGEIPQLGKTVGADGKARKQPAKRKTDDPKLAALRERAAKHGFRIRKRGPAWVAIDADGKPTCGSESLDALNLDFDGREGKIAYQVYTACGMRIDGLNNSQAWLAAHPGATMEDFEKALPPAPTDCELDDADASAEKRKAHYAEAGTITIEDDLEPSEYREAFLLRAADVLAFAVYSGPIDAEVVAAAARAAAKWKKLADKLTAEIAADLSRRAAA
jgi:ParB-like nuclease domain